MLNTIVKVSHITNLSDARYCAGMGVEMVGFMGDETAENYMPLKKFQEIRSWISGVKIVLETTESDIEKIVERSQLYEPDMIQVSDYKQLAWLKAELNIPIVLRVEATQDADEIEGVMHQNETYVSYFLIESEEDVELDADWYVLLDNLAQKYKILVGLSMAPEGVIKLLNTTPQIGIALHGSDEIRPGYKDFGKLMDILEVLEELN